MASKSIQQNSHSALPDLAQDAKVSALINPESGEWKKEVVQSSILPHEAATILGIPISSRQGRLNKFGGPRQKF